jgi:hypothetical protein
MAHSRADGAGDFAGAKLSIKNSHECVVGTGQRDTQSRLGHQDEPTFRREPGEAALAADPANMIKEPILSTKATTP